MNWSLQIIDKCPQEELDRRLQFWQEELTTLFPLGLNENKELVKVYPFHFIHLKHANHFKIPLVTEKLFQMKSNMMDTLPLYPEGKGKLSHKCID